jgi:hypothetical protein
MIRFAVAVLLLLAVTVPLILANSQKMIGSSVFEWGMQKNLTGILLARPYPHLLVPRPENPNNLSPFSTYYLVAQWKLGLPQADILPFDRKRVRLKGTLIYRDNQVMVETRPDWIQVDATKSVPPLPRVISLGRQTLVGEIVDSKCYFGVMNPGQLAPHRACAIRCINGGIPPVLVVRQRTGPAIYLLLVSAEGKPVNQQVLNLVAEPVEITGDIEREGELLILRADPATYRRVDSNSSIL